MPVPPQRPIVINGHDRPLTMVKYNHDGDLLFSCSKSKDGSVCLWRSDTGERVGTYDGHKGVVWGLDVTSTWGARWRGAPALVSSLGARTGNGFAQVS